jgi:ADP-L-glycero-D-manno-heptose 6-epimerase
MDLRSFSPFLVTGGLGFIGSNLVRRLNKLGSEDIVILDRPQSDGKWRNASGLRCDYLDADLILPPSEVAAPVQESGFARALEKLDSELPRFKTMFHLGACSNTQEQDATYLFRNNFCFSALLFELARRRRARFVYASSAATYGDGSLGFVEGRELELRPLNAYAWSKQIFDEYLIRRNQANSCAGIKYFNVYGPNEGAKGSMGSMVYRGLRQLKEEGSIRIFKGTMEMSRDFIHVDDAVTATLWLAFDARTAGGLYNVGSGIGTTWRQLAEAVCDASKTFLGVAKPRIVEVDPPAGLMDHYQALTVANIDKLRGTGFPLQPRDIATGARDVASIISRDGF